MLAHLVNSGYSLVLSIESEKAVFTTPSRSLVLHNNTVDDLAEFRKKKIVQWLIVRAIVKVANVYFVCHLDVKNCLGPRL